MKADGQKYNAWKLTFTAQGGCNNAGAGCGPYGGNLHNGNNYNGRHDGQSPSRPAEQWPFSDLWSSPSPSPAGTGTGLPTDLLVSAPLFPSRSSPRSAGVRHLPPPSPDPWNPQASPRVRGHRGPEGSIPFPAPNAGQPSPASTSHYPSTDNSWSPTNNIHQSAPEYTPPMQNRRKQSPPVDHNNSAQAQTPIRTNQPVHAAPRTGRKAGGLDTIGQPRFWNSQSRTQNSRPVGSNLDHWQWQQGPSQQTGRNQATFDADFGYGTGRNVYDPHSETGQAQNPLFSGQLSKTGGEQDQLGTNLDVFGFWAAEPAAAKPVVLDGGFGYPSGHPRRGNGQQQQYNTAPSSTPTRPPLRQNPQRQDHTSWTTPPQFPSSHFPAADGTQDFFNRQNFPSPSLQPHYEPASSPTHQSVAVSGSTQDLFQHHNFPVPSHSPSYKAASRNLSPALTTGHRLVDALFQTPNAFQNEHGTPTHDTKDDQYKVKGDQYSTLSSTNSKEVDSRNKFNEKKPQGKPAASSDRKENTLKTTLGLTDSDVQKLKQLIASSDLKENTVSGFKENYARKQGHPSGEGSTANVDGMPSPQYHQNSVAESNDQKQAQAHHNDSTTSSSPVEVKNSQTIRKTNLSQTRHSIPTPTVSLMMGKTSKTKDEKQLTGKTHLAQNSLSLSDNEPEKVENRYASSWQEFLTEDSKDTPNKDISVFTLPDGSSALSSRDTELEDDMQQNTKKLTQSPHFHQKAPRHDESVDIRTDRVLDHKQKSTEHGPKSNDAAKESGLERPSTTEHESKSKNTIIKRRLEPPTVDRQQHRHEQQSNGQNKRGHAERDDHSLVYSSQASPHSDRMNKSHSEVYPCSGLRPTKMCSLAFPQCSGYVCDAQKFCLSVESNLTTLNRPRDQQYFRDTFACVMSGLWERGCSTCGEVVEALQALLMDRNPSYNCLLQQFRLCDVLSVHKNQFFILNLLVPFRSNSSFRNDLARTVHTATGYCPYQDSMQAFRTLLTRSPDLEPYLHLL
ncbi:uncharacterized protein LOC143298557 [Babylonia areolata]|uniref:uncharacterized protein LOC143298557 n=1 Tax=Babylonia areolata TaxID=304850 RepID=UPI003FD16B5D